MTESPERSSSPQVLPAGTVTFFFSDIEGSTKHLIELGDRYAALLEKHHLLLRRAIALGGGSELATEGDSFFAVFPTAAGGVAAAIDAQEALLTEPWEHGAPLRVRMGLHTGEGRIVGNSYIGLDVHRAARIAAAAHGGQIVVSAVTAALVSPNLPETASLRDLGVHALKDLDRPEHLFQVTLRGHQKVFPPVRSVGTSRFPKTVNALVGREADLEAAGRLVSRSDVHLVTITGPGGIGKTRLAIELLRSLQLGYPGGVHFIDLSGMTDPLLVVPAVGRALGVLDSENRDIAASIGETLGDADVLAVLDNFEQVVEAASHLSVVLAHSPHLKLIVTSREPLRIRGEYEYPLRPLRLPEANDSTEDAEEAPAMALFLDRARAVVPEFEVDDRNNDALIALVRRLEGVPLAIELAAPKLRMFTPEMLAERFRNQMNLIASDSRDLPARHHTMRTAIRWSYDLLSEPAQTLFRRLGVFSGGFSLDAARQVCDISDDEYVQFMDTIEDLVAKSMVTVSAGASGEPRYRLLETLREFATAELIAGGEFEAARGAHLEWFRGFVQQNWEGFFESTFAQVLDAVEQERHNVRSALEYALSRPESVAAGLEIAGRLFIYWDVRGYGREGLDWLNRLLSQPAAAQSTTGRAHALEARGWLRRVHPGDSDPRRDLSEANRIWEELGSQQGLAWSVAIHGLISFTAMDLTSALDQFERAAAIGRSTGDERLTEIWCTFGLGHIHWAMGDMQQAHTLLLRSLRYARRWRHGWAIGHAQFGLGIIELLRGNLDEARARMEESLLLRRDIRDLRGIADCLGSMALLWGSLGDHVKATTLLGAAEAQRRATGQMLVPWQQPYVDGAMERCRSLLGTEAYEEAFARGKGLGREDAIALALDHGRMESTRGDQVLV